MFKTLKDVALDQALLKLTHTDCKYELQWHMHAKVMEWNSGVILGGKGKRQRWKEGRGRKRRKSMPSFPLLIASSFMLRAAGKVSARAQVEISLLFPLSSLSAAGWTLHFISTSLSVLLFAKSWLLGRNKKWPRAAVINKLDPDRTGRQAGRARSKNTADKVTSCLS